MSDSTMVEQTEDVVRWRQSTAEANTRLQIGSDRHESVNIWKQMSYVPPRGPCGFKYSVVLPTCPCLRFMIHPIKAPTSFECDGCGHHASFHQMQNKMEEEIVSRWHRTDGTFDREAYDLDEEVQEAIAKRRRLGIEGEISSNTEIVMPGKARSTLLGTGKKRGRVAK